MKLKSFEELKNENLKGYCYYVSAWGMSMTSRHSYQPIMWIVLEDNGTECIVAEYEQQSWTKKTLAKELVAATIARNPAISSETFANLIKEVKSVI